MTIEHSTHVVSWYCLALCVAVATGCTPTNTAADSGPDVVTVIDDGGLAVGFFPARPNAFTATTNTARTVKVSVSGEAQAQNAYPYVSNPTGNPVFVDGWTVTFSSYLVVVGNVRMNLSGNDPSMRDSVGNVVASRAESYVVDLHKAGPLVGAGGGSETALPLMVIDSPDVGGSFDPTIRYAFSYDTVPASAAMRNVNLTVDQRADLERMVRSRWTHLFRGTATYVGRTATATVDSTFQRYPRTVNFSFGFSAPSGYINCHNPEIGADDTPSNRGIQPSGSVGVRAQLTLHTDHSFWKVANVEGESLHFDPFAARVADFGMPDPRVLTLDDLSGVNPAMPTDREGVTVRDRGGQTTGYTPVGMNLVLETNGAPGVSDLRDMVAFNTRQQGHLNSDGLCFVKPLGVLSY